MCGEFQANTEARNSLRPSLAPEPNGWVGEASNVDPLPLPRHVSCRLAQLCVCASSDSHIGCPLATGSLVSKRWQVQVFRAGIKQWSGARKPPHHQTTGLELAPWPQATQVNALSIVTSATVPASGARVAPAGDVEDAHHRSAAWPRCLRGLPGAVSSLHSQLMCWIPHRHIVFRCLAPPDRQAIFAECTSSCSVFQLVAHKPSEREGARQRQPPPSRMPRSAPPDGPPC